MILRRYCYRAGFREQIKAILAGGTLPLSAPGIVTGSLLVFIPMMGEYVVPAMLGRGRVFLIGNVLYLDFLAGFATGRKARRWQWGGGVVL